MARPRTISDAKILSVARDCFVEFGPSVAMDVIADRLGVSPQALFKRFRNKHELMLAALTPVVPAPWIALVEAGPDDRDIEEQLAEILTELAEFFVDVARRMSVLRFSGIEPRELMDRFDEPPPLVDIRVLSGWLQRAAERGLIGETDFAATAMLMLTSMHGPAMLTDMLGHHPTGHSREEYVQFMVRTLLQGLRSNEPQVGTRPQTTFQPSLQDPS
jgi:AcrR family transcriptional regulator